MAAAVATAAATAAEAIAAATAEVAGAVTAAARAATVGAVERVADAEAVAASKESRSSVSEPTPRLVWAFSFLSPVQALSADQTRNNCSAPAGNRCSGDYTLAA